MSEAVLFILTFRFESIKSAAFNALVGDLEQNCPEACGIELANAGGEDIISWKVLINLQRRTLASM